MTEGQIRWTSRCFASWSPTRAPPWTYYWRPTALCRPPANFFMSSAWKKGSDLLQTQSGTQKRWYDKVFGKTPAIVRINEKTWNLLSLYLYWLKEISSLTINWTTSFYVSTRYDRELVKWNIREIGQASQSTTGTLRGCLEMTRSSVNTLPPRNIQL